MPIYEFYCPDNHKLYSFFARSLAYRDAVPRCPDNANFRMEKRLSGFAVTGRAKEKTAAPDADFDDPRMEAAMAEMEREMAGMDEENPDPRRMAQLMRKMATLTGEKLPESMEEMIGRLEAGEDPEKLEEEFGDMDDMEGFGDDPECGPSGACGTEESTPGTSKQRTLLRRMRGPTRDPQLYEMTDYL